MTIMFLRCDDEDGTVTVVPAGDDGAPTAADDWNVRAAGWLERLDPDEIQREALTTSSMKDNPTAAVIRVLCRLLRGEELS